MIVFVEVNPPIKLIEPSTWRFPVMRTLLPAEGIKRIFPVELIPLPNPLSTCKLPVTVGVVKAGDVNVLLVNVSVPAKVANVPVVGSVTDVAAVDVNVVENAPTVARVLPEAIVKVEALAGAVNVILFNVLFVNASLPANVANVPVVGSVTDVAAVEVNVVENVPLVANVLPVANVKVAGAAGVVKVMLFKRE